MQDRENQENIDARLTQVLRGGSVPQKIKFRRKLLVFSIFLFLSVAFWFLTALNKNYNTNIYYPVQYINLPQNRVLVNELPDRLRLQVNGHGYTLLGYKLRSRLVPIVFNVNSFSLNKIKNSASSMYILTSYARDHIENQLNSELEVISISPDSLIFEFAEVVRKKLPVVPNLEIRYRKQYMQEGELEINPDSVIVSGPDQVLDTLKAITTRKRIIEEADEDLEFSLPLVMDESLTCNQKKVVVQVPVERYTEIRTKVPVFVRNLPDSLYLRIFPNKVTVTCFVGLSQYENIRPHLFRFVADYKEIAGNPDSKLKVELVKKPEYVRSVKFHPGSVDYIIEK